jgi:hypothetical protein
VAPWLITTPGWPVLAAHLAGEVVRRVGDRTVVAVAGAWFATCALTLLLVTRARPGPGDPST